jgi:hypothetical protein
MTREQIYDALFRPGLVLCAVFALLSFAPTVAASPFGQGVFGAQVPFGSVTSLTIALGSNVALQLSPSGSNFVGSGSHTITVTSTDVVGYSLYIYAPGGTTMSSGTDTIPASSNGTAGALSLDTWGYNTDGSSNYLGMTTTPVLLKTATGPFETGDNTTVTFGVLASGTKSEGSYSTSVTYTAVALTD